ncbi:MAG: hypothetical protein RhofKO_42450 [Rhodothermales bacterium]
MAYFKAREAKSIDYYRRKCEQHLHRTMLSFELSTEALEKGDPDAWIASHSNLFDDGAPNDQKVQRMWEVLIKSHFLLLKVEFELFLHFLGLESWRVALLRQRAGQGALSEKAWKHLKSPSPRSLLAHDDVIEALCAQVVPRYGLPQIAKSAALVGTDVPRLLNADHHALWAQVAVAFQVRHLIEHRNSYIDDAFRSQVSPIWPQTSWGKRNSDLSQEEKVTVTKEDLRVTYEKMVASLVALSKRCDVLTDLRKEYTPQGLL